MSLPARSLAHRATVAVRSEEVRSWEENLDAILIPLRGRSLDDLSAVSGVDLVLIDGALPNALEAARRVRVADSAAQVVLVSEGRDRARLERAVLFMPGLGEIWVVEPGAVDGDLVEKARTVSAQRRAYRSTYRRLEHDLAGIEPLTARRAFISDAYLAALLAVLPDPVVSIGERGQVITWNRAAERVFGRSRADAVGLAALEALGPDDPASLTALLERAEIGRAQGEIRFHREDESRIADVVAVPVEAERRTVRVILARDVTERRRVQEELAARTQEAERARADAESANRAKSEFLATMSHEVRTPINAIVGYTDLLQMGLGGPLTEVQDHQLDRIRASSKHLMMLIEDVLDLAKVEAGRIEVARERAVAVSAVAAALALVAPDAERRGVRLTSRSEAEHDEDDFYVGDEDRVVQVLVNLLSNAIKFSDMGGTVGVVHGAAPPTVAPPGHEPGGGWTYIRVLDRGIGISEADLRRVFRPFEQVEQGTTRSHGGAGLGLAISRELAQLMGGDITVDSAPGAGSTFTLWLPKSVAAEYPGLEATRKEGAAPGEGTGSRQQVMAAVGQVLLSELETILAAFSSRLREELPAVASLEETTLRDHWGSYLADLAQAIVTLGASVPDASLLVRDGSDIQGLIAERHGQQRARLGWTIDVLRHEMAVMYDVIEEPVRERMRGETRREVERALDLIHRILDHAEGVARRHLQPRGRASG